MHGERQRRDRVQHAPLTYESAEGAIVWNTPSLHVPPIDRMAHAPPCTEGQVHLLVYYIKLKSRPSVCLSVLIFCCPVDFSVMCAWIFVILA